MSSTAKLILFFAAATVFNIGLMVALIAVIFVVARLALGDKPGPVAFQIVIVIFVGFIASIVLTFLIYGWTMKSVTKRLDLEKHIPQLFRKKK
jgi:uncharacterized membrane protein